MFLGFPGTATSACPLFPLIYSPPQCYTSLRTCRAGVFRCFDSLVAKKGKHKNEKEETSRVGEKKRTNPRVCQHSDVAARRYFSLRYFRFLDGSFARGSPFIVRSLHYSPWLNAYNNLVTIGIASLRLLEEKPPGLDRTDNARCIVSPLFSPLYFPSSSPIGSTRAPDCGIFDQKSTQPLTGL